MSAEQIAKKLTPAQRETLAAACRGYGVVTDETYRPIVKLLALGLVMGRKQRYGGMIFQANAAGHEVRAILAAQDPRA